jgi:hypothetical protein
MSLADLRAIALHNNHTPKLRDLLPRVEWRKVGGLRFWRIGRLGGSFYLTAR